MYLLLHLFLENNKGKEDEHILTCSFYNRIINSTYNPEITKRMNDVKDKLDFSSFIVSIERKN